MLDLSLPTNRSTLEKLISADIDKYCEEKYRQEPREHLGASVMGEDCSRKLWYGFRWVKEEQFSGRMRRLFQVGHDAEPRLVDYLRGIGFIVWEKDPDTGKQFRISGCLGHYGGSLDGKCKAPARYNLSEDLIFLNEFKTNGTGTGFTSVEDKGVETAKPKHYKQMCQYGWHYKLKYGLYLIENKNDSSLTPKIVELDWKIGQQMELKAMDIITSKVPPPRIAENPSYLDCKYCSYKGICFDNEPVELNCRSCRNAEPIAEGKWYCHRWNDVIPKEAIPKGCADHQSINL